MRTKLPVLGALCAATATGYSFSTVAYSARSRRTPPQADRLDNAAISDIVGKDGKIVRVGKGRIREYHMAFYAANAPIEDTMSISTQPPVGGGALFGIFDGHGGTHCSSFCRDHLFDYIYRFAPPSALSGVDPSSLLGTRAFLQADSDFLDKGFHERSATGRPNGMAGACVIVTHVKGDQVVTANAGDCRAVIGRRENKWLGFTSEWVPVKLSDDHQIADNSGERDRLLREHPGEPDVLGRARDPRVKGGLQPTRAMGDGIYKRLDYFKLLSAKSQARFDKWTPPYVTAEPDIHRHQLDSKDAFLVIATDGLYQNLSRADVVKCVGEQLDNMKQSGQSLKASNLSAALIRRALLAASESAFGPQPLSEDSLSYILSVPTDRKRGIHDDISVVVVLFEPQSIADDNVNAPSKL